MKNAKEKFIGSFDGFKGGVVRGWVKLKDDDVKRLTIDVSSDGQLLKSIKKR